MKLLQQITLERASKERQRLRHRQLTSLCQAVLGRPGLARRDSTLVAAVTCAVEALGELSLAIALAGLGNLAILSPSRSPGKSQRCYSASQAEIQRRQRANASAAAHVGPSEAI